MSAVASHYWRKPQLLCVTHARVDGAQGLEAADQEIRLIDGPSAAGSGQPASAGWRVEGVEVGR